jgi:CubicO group peptidase (beta-lactamase class C family)
MKRLIACLLLTGAVVFAQMTADELTSALENRVNEARKAVGMVAATIDPTATHFASRGHVAPGKTKGPDADTLFEIGSITKVFTSLVLADMIEHKEVQGSDPVQKYLPVGSKVPTRNGKQITLLDLSMQVSGLPSMPTNFAPKDPSNPYVDYDGKKLLEFLATAELDSDPGEKYAYSNVGVGLLGFALASRAGMSYEAMVKKRVLDPLGMNDTSITLSAAEKNRFFIGNDAGLTPVPAWDLDALAGCGALRSTANDLLKFLAAAMGLKDTPLKPAFHRMLAADKPTGVPDLNIAMGWHIWRKYGSQIVWHNGGTAGFRTFIGFDPATKRGAIVLVNTSFDSDDLGLHLIDSRYPLKKYDAAKADLEIDPKILDTYVGEYQLAPEFSIAVTRDGTHVYAQATNQPRFEIFADKENEFFLKVVEARVTFEKDASGKVTGMVLHQGGRDMPGKKIH